MANTKKCVSCQSDKRKSEFYASYSKLHADGKMPYCKECLQSIVDISDINTVKDALTKIDRPFLYDLWVSTLKSGGNVFGIYIKNIQMPQYRYLTWKDSQHESSVAADDDYDELLEDMFDEQSVLEEKESFVVTKEMTRRWGKKYNREMIFGLEQFYQQMLAANRIETPQDDNYVRKLAVISVKMDQELQAGNYDQAKKLGDLFSKYMTDSKLRAMDQSDATKTGGLRTFGQIYAEVEKDGFIPPWQQFAEQKNLEQDVIDKTIMYILNYNLKLAQMTQMVTPPSDTPKVRGDD